MFAWFLGQVVWTPFHRTDVSIWKPTISNSSGVHEVFDSRLVKQQNLFGEFHKDVTSVQTAALVNAPKTKLNLKLVGVVVSDKEKDNLAIIALQGSNQLMD
ncbi:type II secretion system protein N [Vibrio sp. PP-XX7]